MLSLCLAFLVAPSSAAVPELSASPSETEASRAPVARRLDRRSERTLVLEDRLIDAVALQMVDPANPQAQRRKVRFENKLVTQRARQVRLERRVAAEGLPAHQVEVFYATTRERWPRHGRWYSARDAGRLSYGIVTVRIPEEHQVGEVERALEVVSVDELAVADWEERLSRATGQAGGELFAYVHGYNNSFAYSARRTAQITHDLGAPVVPVLFSWPANGGTPFAGAKYVVDENVAARSSLFLARFIDQVLTLDPKPSLSVFAHSLGSRVMSDALLDLDRSGGLSQPLHQLVFAAPDIDAWLFANRYLPLAVSSSNRFTVYCARDDRALRLSRGMHGRYDRLGGCRDGAVAGLQREGVDVVDTSKLYVDLLDHNKVTSSPRLLRDLRLVLAGLDWRHPSRKLVDRGDRAELPP